MSNRQYECTVKIGKGFLQKIFDGHFNIKFAVLATEKNDWNFSYVAR
jgi:hypothetical protein